MRLYSGITGEAQELVQKNQSILDRCPRTFLVSILLEFEKWSTLFEPEKVYFRILLSQLGAFTASEFESMFAGLAKLEMQAGCGQVTTDDPKTLQDRTQTLLRKEGLLSSWRHEIDGIFQKLQPILESQLYAGDTTHRLVVILYGKGIAIERDKLWKRFRDIGIRIPLDLNVASHSEAFLSALFTGHPEEMESDGLAPPPIFKGFSKNSPLDCWIVEAGDALHGLCEKSAKKEQPFGYATGMSFDRLRSYRDQLTKTLYAKVQSGISGPLELAAYARTLKITPQEGLTFYTSEVVLAFLRDIFLAGNGTLFMNNSFVEWAAVQAIKRAQPRMLVARFGVRDKMKPFSSLLLFSKPRTTDQIPILEDPLGSFIDVELLSYYIWLNTQKGPPYRQKTLFLLLAEGVDEMLALLPGSREPASADLPTATLPDIAATMAHWLDLPSPASPGRVIQHLVG